MQPQSSSEAQGSATPQPPRDGRGRIDLGAILGLVALGIAVVALVLNLAVPGPAGATGASYTVGTVLEHGQNETGVYSAFGGNGSLYLGDNIEFRIPLTSDLPSQNTTFIAAGGAYTTSCPGPGQALPGQLCVYETLDSGLFSPTGQIMDPSSYAPGASRWGFAVTFYAAASGSFSYGTWTVAAP